MTRQRVQQIESGRTPPTVTTMNKVAAAMDIDLWELILDGLSADDQSQLLKSLQNRASRSGDQPSFATPPLENRE